MKKKLLAIFLCVALALSMVACGGSEESSTAEPSATEKAEETSATTEAKDTVILATSGEPYRFYAQGSKSCGGDDNLVL